MLPQQRQRRLEEPQEMTALLRAGYYRLAHAK
jgi:hypothetical protein